MGLDVYLYHYLNDPEVVEKLKEEFSQKEDALYAEYPEYGKITTEQRHELGERREALQKIYDLDGLEEGVEFDSAKYPEHLFKVGYCRSSYNSGGINRVLRDATDKDLYYIFDPPENYEFVPDWEACRERAIDAIESFKESLDEGIFLVESITHSKNPLSAETALELFHQKLQKSKEGRKAGQDWGHNFTSSEGTFYLTSPLEVYGFVAGENLIKQPCMHVIHKGVEMEWYLEALEITLETIDYVLSQPDPDSYGLHWSG